MSLKGQVTITAVIIGLVSAVIGFTIIDQIVAPAANPSSGTLNEFTTNTSLGEGYGLIEGALVIINASDSTDTLTIVDDYNITFNSGVLVIGYEWDGNSMNATYDYVQAEYLNSSLSRTIVSYVVPIGLLGVLAMAAFLATR